MIWAYQDVWNNFKKSQHKKIIYEKKIVVNILRSQDNDNFRWSRPLNYTKIKIKYEFFKSFRVTSLGLTLIIIFLLFELVKVGLHVIKFGLVCRVAYIINDVLNGQILLHILFNSFLVGTLLSNISSEVTSPSLVLLELFRYQN